MTDKTKNQLLDEVNILKKQLALKATESEDTLRTLFNTMTDVVFEMDYDGKYINIAPTSPKHVYSMPEDAEGKTLHDIFPKQQADIFLDFIQRCLNSRKTISITYPLVIENSTIWFEGIATPNSKNNVLFIARDVTDKKRAQEELIATNQQLEASNQQLGASEQQLRATNQQLEATNQQLIASEQSIRESEEKYRNIFHHAPIGLLTLNKEGFPVNMNQHILDILGSPSAEATRKINVLTFQNLIDAGFSGDVEKCFDTGKIIKNECFYTSSWGVSKYVKYILSPIYEKNHEVIGAHAIFEDITNEYQLRKSVAEKTMILDNILKSAVNMAIVTTDLDLNITYFNPIAEKYFSAKAGDVIGKSLYQIHATQKVEASKFKYAIETVKQKGEFVYQLDQDTDNGVRHLSSRVTGILDSEKNIVGYALFSRDVTTQVKSKKALVDSERSFRAIFDNAVDAIYIQNHDGTFIDVNQGVVNMYGYEKSELIGVTPDIIAAPGMNDLDMVRNCIDKAYNGEPQQFEFWGKKKNGEIFPKIVRVSSGYYFGKKTIFAFAVDISKQKRAEQIQKLLFNISNAVTTTSSLSDFIDRLKSELGALIDTKNFYIAFYDSNTDSLSMPYYADEKDSFKSASAYKTLTKYVIESDKSLFATKAVKDKLVKEGKLEYQGSRSKVWMGVPLKTNGKTIGVFAVQSYENEDAYSESDMEILEFVSDQISISLDRKKNEIELRKQNEEFAKLNSEYKVINNNLVVALKKAEESERLKTVFLQNISHEIRTPMNGILGFTSLLKTRCNTSEEQESYVDLIMQGGSRMLNTINDIVDIAKIETGHVQVKYSQVNINKELYELFMLFEKEAKSNGLLFNYSTTQPVNVVNVSADRTKFVAILTNLVKNAIKYTNKGSVEFGYKLNPLEVNAKFEFYVKDTGIGINEGRLAAIFEKFMQADISDIKAYEGSGLGLAISKVYVEMLGGEIWVESVEGVGSQFFFTMPYKRVQLGSEKQVVDSDNSFIKNLQGLVVLIAEDDFIADAFLEATLKKLNCKVIHVKTGQDAIDECRNNTEIDLILMDIKMPNINGYEATIKIREFNKDVIIIAQTAYALSGDKQKALNAGCNDYISKPISSKILIDKIRKLFVDSKRK